MVPENRGGGLAPGFRRFWWGETVSGFGTAVTSLALQTLVVVTPHGGAVQVGWLSSARWLPFLVVGPLVGALVDRARRRPTAGPAVAGLLIKVVGAPLSILVDAVTYLFSAVMVATLPSIPESRPARSTMMRAGGLAAEIREGVRWVYGQSGLGRLAVATPVWFAAQAVLVVVVIPYAHLQLQLSPFQLGVVFAVAGVGALIGAAVSTTVGNRLGVGGAIICSHAVSSLGVVNMVTAGLAPTGCRSAAALAAGQFCHGWAMGVSDSHEMSYRQALTPDTLQARTKTTMRSLTVSATAFALSASLLVFSLFRQARAE